MSRMESCIFVVRGKEINCKRFQNPDGSIGGWVADGAIVDPGAYVELDALVGPNSVVKLGDRILSGVLLFQNKFITL